MQEKAKTFKKGFKYRIYPNKEQQIYLAKIFGSCRFVYNRLLADCIKEYQESKLDSTVKKKLKLSGFDMINRLQVIKNNPDTDWLKENPTHVIQASAKNLGDAFSMFFKTKTGYPKFKSKRSKQSATFSNFSYTLKDKVLKLAKCETPMKVKWSRDLPIGIPGQMTITKTPSGKYFASIICEYTPVITDGTGIIGVDAGITDLAVLSDGTFIPNLRCYVEHQKDLRKLQRRHSRKSKGSKNKEKSRLKIAKLHEKIANVRNDYLHKLTTKLVRENQAVAIESLNVKNMSKNRKLSKHILDASWGKMREQLMYKSIASQHCKLFLANPYYPSTQLCSDCGERPKEKLKLGTRRWVCHNCGAIHQRDHNAAKNLENLVRSHIGHINPKANIVLTGSYIPYQ